MHSVVVLTAVYADSWSAKTIGREPESCLGRVFNSKLDRFATPHSTGMPCILTLILELKVRPRFSPVNMTDCGAFGVALSVVVLNFIYLNILT